MPEDFVIVEALDPASIAQCRELFLEYRNAIGIGVCFHGFEAELAALPGDYAPPRGRLLLARKGAKAAGCVAIRPLFHQDAEMKRLYVRRAHRGGGLGRRLAEAAIAASRSLGYEALKLDTLPTMHAAHNLYATLGFHDTAPYNDSAAGGIRYLALDLRP